MKNEKNNGDNEKKSENIKDYGIARLNGRHGNIYCLSVIGQIEGHSVLPQDTKTTKYEHIIPMLVSVEEDENIDGMLILLNTVGGDVEAGLAIAELISGMEKPTVSLVLGGGHSIGVPLAVSADYSYIAPSASMIVHPVRMSGTIITVPQSFEYLIKMQDSILDFVTAHSDISKERLRSLMMTTSNLANDAGTILYGKEAADEKLIDDVGTISSALKKLKELIDKKAKV